MHHALSCVSPNLDATYVATDKKVESTRTKDKYSNLHIIAMTAIILLLNVK
jgi:hypothetical protein